MKKLNVGVLVSGNGSNLQAIIDQIEKGMLTAEIKIVITNNSDAYALERCRKHGIFFSVTNHLDFTKREDFDRHMVDILESYEVELVVLAGFMRVLTPLFLRAFPMRVMNIHPALLPAFPGTHVQQKALEYGVKFSGCTVHFVDEGVDTGPIIIQAVVPVYDGDTVDSLSARILKEEHRIYPQAIQFYAEGKLKIEGRNVLIGGGNKDLPALHNPPLTQLVGCKEQ
jgi:phosphoribosylglycinamide formyltransferase-1